MQYLNEILQLLDRRSQTYHQLDSPGTVASIVKAVHARKATVSRSTVSAFKLAFIVQIIVNARNGNTYSAKIQTTCRNPILILLQESYLLLSNVISTKAQHQRSHILILQVIQRMLHTASISRMSSC